MKFKIRQPLPKITISYSALTLWLCMFPSIGATATIDWNYNGSTDWGSAVNWNAGRIPGSFDFVRINQSGSQGPVISGTSFTINNLSLGDSANGSLIIHNGGELITTGGVTTIGNSQGQNGSVTVSGRGSVWNVNNGVFLGNEGNGSLTIENGATVNMLSAVPKSSTIFMGANNPGGTDYLTITGTGSSLNLTQWLLLAYGGNASFHDTTSIVEVSDGAIINADGIDVGYGGHGILTVNSGGTIVTQHGLISPYVGSKGEVTISGQGSRWSIAEELNVAFSGNGSLTVSDGGKLEDKTGFIASGSGSTANVTVTGLGSHWDNSGELYIGAAGNGTLTINNGGYVSSYNGFIAAYTGSTADVTVTGSGSRWENTNGLVISYQGDGVLTIAEGATVSALAGVNIAVLDDTNGTLNIGAAANQSASAPGTLVAPEITFGSGNGNIVFNHTAGSDEHYIFSPMVTGNGSIDFISGVTTFTAPNTYSGLTTIDGGSLKAGNDNTFSPNSQYTVNTNGSMDLAGFNQEVGELVNAGSIAFNGMPGSSFSVTNNYTGKHGILVLNTELGDDTSSTDKLIVNGDTSGQTDVIINNVGGQGAETINGIDIIEVKGQSDGTFTLKNRVVAGAYEYFLHKNSLGTEDGDWYLRSSLSDGNKEGSTLRPESGSYLANITEASSLFNLRLADREGRAENSSMWLRQVGTHTRFRDNSGQLKTQSNKYVIQGGGELFDTRLAENDRLGVGVMFGYGHISSHTGSTLSGQSSKGDLNGYSAGVYGTWYQNAKNHDGVYIDSWLQYNWFNANVNGNQLSTESYNINGFNAAIESGYRLPVYQGQNGQVFITPQAQATWSGQSSNNHIELNGTRVKADAKDNIQTRLGIKLSRDGVSERDKGQDKLFTVYTEANWLYNSKQASAQLGELHIYQDGTRNIGELKLGMEGKLNRHLNIWTNVTQQLGDAGYSNTGVVLGVKYAF
ncbi:autotransporter family porin [Pragia fontium DSM 5563 = ATCC 49100]|uniref:Autotransporter family porin n=2 Tax=Pragia fontium TaxID=82985 RepID=A0AAJ4WDI1_9GAMM|nr:autotransporter family porin [Pragia fontium DSM 5563 = ATCC 49100]